MSLLLSLPQSLLFSRDGRVIRPQRRRTAWQGKSVFFSPSAFVAKTSFYWCHQRPNADHQGHGAPTCHPVGTCGAYESCPSGVHPGWEQVAATNPTTYNAVFHFNVIWQTTVPDSGISPNLYGKESPPPPCPRLSPKWNSGRPSLDRWGDVGGHGPVRPTARHQ